MGQKPEGGRLGYTKAKRAWHQTLDSFLRQGRTLAQGDGLAIAGEPDSRMFIVRSGACMVTAVRGPAFSLNVLELACMAWRCMWKCECPQ